MFRTKKCQNDGNNYHQYATIMSAPTPPPSLLGLSKVLHTFVSAFNEPDALPVGKNLSLKIPEGADPRQPEHFGCLPLVFLTPLHSNSVYQHLLDWLHPAGLGIDCYDSTYLSATPVIFTLLKQQKFIKAKMLFDRGARLDFCHPILKCTSLQMLCIPFEAKPEFSPEQSYQEIAAQVMMIETAMKNIDLPWKHRGRMVIPEEDTCTFNGHPLSYSSAIELLTMISYPPMKYPINPEMLAILSCRSEEPVTRELLTSGTYTQLKEEYLQFFQLQKQFPLLPKILAFEPSDLLISLMFDQVIPHHQALDAFENTFSHLAAEHGDVPLMKRLLRLGCLSPKANSLGQNLFYFPKAYDYHSDEFMKDLFLIDEIPEAAGSGRVQSPLTRILVLWLLSGPEKPFRSAAVKEWAHFFFDSQVYFYTRMQTLKTIEPRHVTEEILAKSYCDAIQDSCGRTPLELATEISSMDKELYQKLAIYETQRFYTLDKVFDARALKIFHIAFSKNDYGKICDLMSANFPLLQTFPIRGGTPYLNVCKKSVDLLNQDKPFLTDDETNLIFSCIFYTHRFLKKINFGDPCLFLNSKTNSLEVGYSLKIIKTFHEKAEKCLRTTSENLEASPLARIRENLAYLSEQEPLVTANLESLDDAVDHLHGPSLCYYFIMTETHHHELVKQLLQIKKIFLERRRTHPEIFQGDEAKLLMVLINFLEIKSRQLELTQAAAEDQLSTQFELAEKTVIANKMAEDLVTEEDRKKQTSLKKRPKKNKKKAKPAGGAGRDPSPEPILEAILDTLREAATALDRFSPQPSVPVIAECVELVVPPPPVPMTLMRTIHETSPDCFLPYLEHYRILDHFFAPKILPFAELDRRLWVYGSILDSKTKSFSQDIDFVLYLKAPLSEASIVESTVYFRKALEAGNPGIPSDWIKVEFYPGYQCWALISPRLCIDIRLSISPELPETLIQRECAEELIRHRAQRFNPRTGEWFHFSSEDFELSRDPYQEGLPQASLIAYLIKNFAVSTRKLASLTEMTLSKMMMSMSLNSATPEVYALHFIALSLAFYKYGQHRKILLAFCDEHQCFPRLLGIGEGPALRVQDLSETEANPFYAACVLYRGQYSQASIQRIKDNPGLQARGTQAVIAELL